jgi:hypothetical protein
MILRASPLLSSLLASKRTKFELKPERTGKADGDYGVKPAAEG